MTPTTTTAPAPDTRTQPPFDLAVEQAVLGAVMMDADAFAKSRDHLTAEAFYDSRHQHIYAACQRLHNDGRRIDLHSVSQELRSMRCLETVTLVYLAETTASVTGGANVEYHSLVVLEHYMRRRIMQLSDNLKRKASAFSEDVYDTQEYAEQQLLEISGLVSNRDSHHIESVVHQLLEHLETASQNDSHVSGIATGIPELDDMTSGLHPSNLVIIGARPSMGKTALMLQLALNAAQRSTSVAIFSMEMSAMELSSRFVSNLSNVNGTKLKSPKWMTAEDWHHLTTASDQLARLPLIIDDTPGLSIYDLRAKARRLKAEHGIDLILVDYLQLMKADAGKQASRENEISKISRGLKILAKELSVPVVALAQLNRQVEARPDKRPMKSDIRESGAIEQDADLIMFLYRPQYYGLEVDENGEGTQNLLEIIVDKQRNGETGSVRTHINLPTGRITPWQGGNDWQADYQKQNQQLMNQHMNGKLREQQSDDEGFDAPF